MKKYNLPVNYDELHPSERKLIREQYIKEQEEKCYYCGGNLNETPPENITKKYINKKLFPESFFLYPVHLHHDHVTGMTIGAVHNYCNAILWQYHGE